MTIGEARMLELFPTLVKSMTRIADALEKIADRLPATKPEEGGAADRGKTEGGAL